MERQIIRRKAKRIERAGSIVRHMQGDIEDLESISEPERQQLLGWVRELSSYLKNDDKEENKYNHDNAND